MNIYLKLILTIIVLLLFSSCGGAGGPKVDNEQGLQGNEGGSPATSDEIKPVITLLGNRKVFIKEGNKYIDAGATASDDIDGDITSNIQISSNVDTLQAGTYTVKYNVSDKSGNRAEEKVRTVIVLDEDSYIYGVPGNHKVITYTEKDEGHSVLYYPEDRNREDKIPIILFAASSNSQGAAEYRTLLEFVASHGYMVVCADDTFDQNNPEHTADKAISYFEKMLNDNEVLQYADKTRIGVVGHSVGGGEAFKILDHFSKNGYGANGRFIMAIEPWFAFDTDSKTIKGLPSNTNVVIQQYGKGGNNIENDTDPRIPLSEYNLLESIPYNKKDYQVYENANHLYPMERSNDAYPDKQYILKPLDALMVYTFKGRVDAHDAALEVGSDDPVGDGLQVINPIDSYHAKCNGWPNENNRVSDIDYCSIY